jgi:signal transduction histidine kinase
MAPTKSQNLRRDIGGRFLADPRPFLVLVPLWWGLSLLGVPDITTPRVLAISMGANAVAFSVLLLFWTVFKRTWFQHRALRPVPVSQVIAAGAILGAIKSLATVGVTSWGLSDPVYWDFLVWRVPAGAITGAWMLPTAAIVLATRARYQAQRDVLIAELLRSRLAHSPAGSNLRVDDPTNSRVQAIITEAKSMLDDSSIAPEVLAIKLGDLIDKKLRPLSHELWAGKSRKVTDFSLADLIGILLGHRRYWVWPTTLLVILTNGPFVISVVGWGEGVTRLAITAVTAYTTLKILSVGKTVRATAGLGLLAIGALTFTVTNEIVAYSVVGPFDNWPLGLSGVINVLIYLANAIVLGVARVARQDNHDIRRELEKLLGDGSWQGRLDIDQARLRNREVAELLHGRIQNRLLAVALSLSGELGNRAREDVITELTAIENTLLGSSPPPVDDARDGVDKELAKLATRWSGIVNVSVTCEVAGALDAALVSHIVRVGEESISNAVRHGLASTVSLTLCRDNADMVLTAADNGVGPRNGLPGLGSLYLSQMAGKNWSLYPGPDGEGSVLTVRFDGHGDPGGQPSPTATAEP